MTFEDRNYFIVFFADTICSSQAAAVLTQMQMLWTDTA